jgi:hypothetical protein
MMSMQKKAKQMTKRYYHFYSCDAVSLMGILPDGHLFLQQQRRMVKFTCILCGGINILWGSQLFKASKSKTQGSYHEGHIMQAAIDSQTSPCTYAAIAL